MLFVIDGGRRALGGEDGARPRHRVADVSSVSPAADASGVARTTKVTAVFDRAMDKSSAEAAFSLKRTSDGAAGERQLQLVRRTS